MVAAKVPQAVKAQEAMAGHRLSVVLLLLTLVVAVAAVQAALAKAVALVAEEQVHTAQPLEHLELSIQAVAAAVAVSQTALVVAVQELLS